MVFIVIYKSQGTVFTELILLTGVFSAPRLPEALSPGVESDSHPNELEDSFSSAAELPQCSCSYSIV